MDNINKPSRSTFSKRDFLQAEYIATVEQVILSEGMSPSMAGYALPFQACVKFQPFEHTLNRAIRYRSTATGHKQV